MPDPLGDLSFTWPFYAAALGGYFLGSIPFGLVLCSLAGYGDIRKIGSGNIGFTNVLRTGNRPLAVTVLLLDSGKGAIAVLVAGIFSVDMAVLAGGAAILGHSFPVWLGFRGGKSVATSLGTLLAIAPLVGILSCLTWVLVAVVTRISSLSALISITLSGGYAWALSGWVLPDWMGWLAVAGPYAADLQRTELCAFITLLVVFRHTANIRRLIRGEEPKMGKKKT